jgi:hypothetical protein
MAVAVISPMRNNFILLCNTLHAVSSLSLHLIDMLLPQCSGLYPARVMYS